MNDWLQYQRHLPHWQHGGSAHFVTWHCAAGLVLPPAARDIVADNLRHFEGVKYLLHVAVVMPTHVHVLLTPVRNAADGPVHELSSIRHSAKSYSAHKINALTGRGGRVWQDEGYDRVIRSEKHFRAVAAYIVRNPVRGQLVKHPDHYRWLLYQQVA